ncbi:MAG: FKBP-type peptidyl-prolyl cis-trans isomerase [Thermoplasmatales archaeon]
MQFRTLIVILMVLVIAVPVAAYGSYSYIQHKEIVIKPGDNVSLWYYGYIIVNGNPLVFDTNMASVANNNVTYIKAPDFKYHPPFTPLNDTVGSGTMIKGFDDGLIGMAKGQTGLITVSPSQGYGLENLSQIKKIPVNETVPVYETLNYSTFMSTFNTSPVAGALVRNPATGWYVYVISFNGYYANIENEPQIGQRYFPYENVTGFSILVQNITGSGKNSEIQFTMLLINGTILPSGSYISGISNGYYYLNSNPYLAGKTLYFYVDIISVKS